MNDDGRRDPGKVRVKKGDISVDFIDRHPHAAQLFADAVAAAQEGPGVANGEEAEAPVVPKRYLLAMKLIPHEEKDERDAQELLKTMDAAEYHEARRLAEKYLGPIIAEHLDDLARQIGHAGVKPRYG